MISQTRKNRDTVLNCHDECEGGGCLLLEKLVVGYVSAVKGQADFLSFCNCRTSEKEETTCTAEYAMLEIECLASFKIN
jgi:hypothetical protein